MSVDTLPLEGRDQGWGCFMHRTLGDKPPPYSITELANANSYLAVPPLKGEGELGGWGEI